MQFVYRMPTEIQFGAGKIQDIGDHISRFGQRPFVVTGRGSARKNGALDHVLAAFPQAVLFEGVDEDPETDLCDKAAAKCRASECDVVVAIGGGSPMDAAKAVAGLVCNEGRCADYIGRDTFTKGALPLIAAPTTAGSGSEVTPYSVLIHTEHREKATIGGENLFPKVALLDPELTRFMPRQVTVNTGLDALSQCMEGMVSKNSTPKGDILALEGCRLIRRWLPEAANDGENLEARAQMHFAAMLSGCVIAQSRTTLVHGMGYPLTVHFRVRHGLANALLLTPMFRHNAHYAPEKVAALAEALGYPADPTPESAADRVAEALHAILKAVDVSPAAKDAGVDGDRLDEIAAAVAASPHRFKNQIGEITEAKLRAMYEQAYQGSIRETA